MTRREIVTPSSWCDVRDGVIQNYRPPQLAGGDSAGGKYMDAYPLRPFDRLPEEEKAILGAEWTAYELMLFAENKKYILDTICGDFGSFMDAPRNPWGNERIVVADFGCGNGGVTKRLVDEAIERKISSDFYMIDRSSAALDQGLQRFQKDQFVQTDTPEDNPNSIVLSKDGPAPQTLHFMQKDVANTSLPDGSVDIVTCVNVFHHLTSGEIIKVANEMDRVLKPGGRFIIEDVTKPSAINPYDRFILPKIIDKNVSISEMKRLATAAGIEITSDFLEGAGRFIYDAHQAFAQALSLKQCKQLLEESNLGKSVTSVTSLKAPELLKKIVFPPMIYVLGTQS